VVTPTIARQLTVVLISCPDKSHTVEREPTSMAMQPSTQRTTKSVFLAAIDIIEQAKRSRYVAKPCGSDISLHAEVDLLICANWLR